MRQVVFLAHRHCRHKETLDKCGTSLAITVYYIIYSALVVLLEHLHMQNVLAYKYLVGCTHHLVLTVFEEHYYVVDVGAVAHKLVLLKSGSDKSLLSIDVQFLVSLHHLRCLNGVEALYLGAAWMVLAIFVAYEFKPLHSYVNHMSQVVLNVGKFCLDACYKFVGLVFVVFQYALHLYFEQTQNVVACDVAVECIFIHVGIASACVSGRHTEHLILERLKL